MLKKIANKILCIDNYAKIRRLYKHSNGFIKTLLKIYWSVIAHIKGFQISLDCNIGNDCVFPHGMNGIFISSGSKIGNGAVIFHQVTIGSNTLKDSKGQGAPTIGDNVYIGCGAKIIGCVRIGDNVRIGANCVVQDIDDNCTVVLPKPRIIKHTSLKINQFEKFKI